MKARTKLADRFFYCLLFVPFLFMASLPAFATNAGGVDTPNGVTTLPLAAEGQTCLTVTATDANATPPTTAGVSALCPLTTTGNVGIGTASPAGILDVEGGTAASGNGTNIDIAAQNGHALGNTNGGNIILLPGAANGTGSAGRVGVGTATPENTGVGSASPTLAISGATVLDVNGES